MAENPNDWDPATKLIRGGLSRSQFGETAEALYLTQSFVYDSAADADARFSGENPGYIYSRYANPTTSMFEERLALLEGAEYCRALASGMAAVHVALTGLLRAGDHLVAGRALFGSCRWICAELLPRFGVETTFVDATDLDAWQAAMRPNTKAVLIETPANPLLEITDIAAVAKIAHAAGAKVVVDNVFGTPIFQKPLTLGADIVVYSATKHIDGQGRVLGGAILGAKDLLEESYRDIIRHTGPAISPFNSWVLLKGIETLDLRVRRQTETAAALADQIADHPASGRTLYPGRADHPQAAIARAQMTGFSNLIAFDLGTREAAWRFLDALEIVDISNNLGDAKSMATHPSTTTHRAMPEDKRLEIGLTDGYVRMSVGLEGAGDLARDVGRALDAARANS
ncbi:O-succinylhomoserine sulfhydrylase [Caulobacter ginsengisoli]|uniref:O-succinylhomoserine sulfhydrylase n=1 Tax=Caulobacter ginsengisoli TaxID=400775 RepID=A0ABU0IRA2_9CAUL|nr:O-succinylhomoserine sulfhydrylase [Caulobacter ginsengisoli]MDQ0464540.1 O-succinylhomoserine sulfhydrylase [Caulobacter ginsengisoli]